VSFGAADFGGTEAEARKVFEFGKKLKVKTIISDPPPESLILLDKLANEYNINVALTSATTARRYVTCEIMLDAMKDRSKRIAVCADLMAWKLAGQDPIECVKKLSGHVVLVHLSDVDAEKHSVPVGAGTVDAAGAMTELKAQGFKGICCVDDDSDGQPARLAEFAKSVSAFSDMVTKLAAAP
jgi:sugar phosphate isomerase/epimerase